MNLGIQELVSAFEDHSLDSKLWTHAAHVTVASFYVIRFGREIAEAKMRDGVQRYNAACQKPPDAYHETITVAWVALISKWVRERNLLAGASASANASGLSETIEKAIRDVVALGDKNFLLRHYSRERLFSDEARRQWVAPDLQAID